MMKTKRKNIFFASRISWILGLLPLLFVLFFACSTSKRQAEKQPEPAILKTNVNVSGMPLEIIYTAGRSHNHPLMAVWIEDIDGNYIETLYVAASIGTGIFGHGTVTDGHWKPGPVSRPAALPYWTHKFGRLPDSENPVPDAISGPTPVKDFVLETNIQRPVSPFRILFEINQSWDWNEYWTNDKFPENEDYKTSSQPAIVYEVLVDPSSPKKEYTMKAIGHSHFAGENGMLFSDMESLTTAKEIVASIVVRLQ